MSVNKAFLLGRLTRDPEIKNVNGLDIANFGLATNKVWYEESGEKREKAEFHNIVCFRKLATVCGKYLAKGKQCFIEGEISTKSWEDAGIKKYRTEIIADRIEFLGDKFEEKLIEQSTTMTPPPSRVATEARVIKNYAPGAGDGF